jgi:hypothetical protein
MFSAKEGFFSIGNDDATMLADNKSEPKSGGQDTANLESNPSPSFRQRNTLSALQPQPQNPYSSQFPQNNTSFVMSPLQMVFVNGNTWRTQAPPDMIYGIMARLLSQSYIMNGTDRKNFALQTDWDKFFIEGRLFRNRMSVMVFPVGPRQTEIVIKNTVEYYTGSAGKKEEGELWLPSPDVTDEVVKLVDNTNKHTAFAYNQSLQR